MYDKKSEFSAATIFPAEVLLFKTHLSQHWMLKSIDTAIFSMRENRKLHWDFIRPYLRRFNLQHPAEFFFGSKQTSVTVILRWMITTERFIGSWKVFLTHQMNRRRL